jgi:hypothetical protein
MTGVGYEESARASRRVRDEHARGLPLHIVGEARRWVRAEKEGAVFDLLASRAGCMRGSRGVDEAGTRRACARTPAAHCRRVARRRRWSLGLGFGGGLRPRA